MFYFLLQPILIYFGNEAWLFRYFFVWKKKALEDFWDILPLAEFLKIDKIIPLNFKFENIHDSERYIDLNVIR